MESGTPSIPSFAKMIRGRDDDQGRERVKRRLVDRCLLASLVAAATVALIAPAGAGAATTIGQTFTPTSPPSPYTCSADTTQLQTTSSSSSYAAPQAGVITSWSFQAEASPPQLRLKVGRAAGAVNNFTIVGESGLQTPLPNTLNTYLTQISVAAGDMIGSYSKTSGGCFNAFATGYSMHYLTGDLAPSTTSLFLEAPTYQMDVAAKLEADADHDGFGDETQDQCPGQAGPDNGCPSATGPTGRRAAALKKCKKKFPGKAKAKKRKKCKKKANLLPV